MYRIHAPYRNNDRKKAVKLMAFIDPCCTSADQSHCFIRSSSYFVIILILLITVFDFDQTVNSQKIDLKSNNTNITFFFNCEPYDVTQIICYHSKIPVHESLSTGISEKIYQVSSERGDYVKGQHGEALQLNSRLGE